MYVPWLPGSRPSRRPTRGSPRRPGNRPRGRDRGEAGLARRASRRWRVQPAAATRSGPPRAGGRRRARSQRTGHPAPRPPAAPAAVPGPGSWSRGRSERPPVVPLREAAPTAPHRRSQSPAASQGLPRVHIPDKSAAPAVSARSDARARRRSARAWRGGARERGQSRPGQARPLARTAPGAGPAEQLQRRSPSRRARAAARPRSWPFASSRPRAWTRTRT